MSLFALFYRQVGGLLFLDTDFALLRDPYTQLKAPPLSRASLVLMPDLRGSATPVNAGLWYAQGEASSAHKGDSAAQEAARTGRRRQTGWHVVPPDHSSTHGEGAATVSAQCRQH